MGRLLLTLAGEDDELAFVRGIFYTGRRDLRPLRESFGEDVLLARDGGCFAVAHLKELAESGRRLRFETARVRPFALTVPVPFGAAGRLVSLDEASFADIVERGLAMPPAFAEDHRTLEGVPGKSATELDVVAAYGLRCALTRYRAGSLADALGRLEVVYLRPLDEGGAETITNALPVDSAIAYALRHGHIVIGDDLRLEVVEPLPATPAHPLRRRLAAPARPEHRPGPEAIHYHRRRFVGS